jgi:hypothetical protein
MKITRGKNNIESLVRHPELLRVLMQIHHWECNQRDEFGTMSGRDLYLRLAMGLLIDDATPQPLKMLKGQQTDRAMRLRLKDFQNSGWLDVVGRQGTDLRVKRAIPSPKFVNRLNSHLDLLMQMCEAHFLMIKKDESITEE